MRWTLALLGIITCGLVSAAQRTASERPERRYLWTTDCDPANSIAARFAPPAGYQRTQAAPKSFPDWLCYLPLHKGKPPVLLFDGRPKSNQTAHAAVLTLDVGDRDLQQCADSIIRLRAEYLFSVAQQDQIHFKFTSGHRADFSKWAAGFRPVIRGNDVQWRETAAPDSSYRSLRRYLDVVFTYAGTVSLSGELTSAKPSTPIEIGDIFIHAGSPGHAAIVVDVAENAGKRVFLLAPGFMPAPQMHILKNPNDESLSPWYDAQFPAELKTPEWTFNRTERKRF